VLAMQATLSEGGYIFPIPRISAADASRARLLSSSKRKLADVDAPISSTTANKKRLSPAEFVLSEFKANGLDVGSEIAQNTPFLTFLEPTEEMIAGYKIETISAVRNASLDVIRSLHASGTSFQCCNRFGESIIHLACRRGNIDTVRFLIREANVSLLLKDDFGRTPLHDACWTAKPRFDLVELIVEEVPELLCVQDVRGHTPLHYVRNEDWDEWMTFFQTRRSLLRPRQSSSSSSTAEESQLHPQEQ